MVKISKIRITIICMLIFSVIFAKIIDIQDKNEYKYNIYNQFIYIGKCKDIETTKSMSQIKIIDFVGIDGMHTKTLYTSEKYRIVKR